MLSAAFVTVTGCRTRTARTRRSRWAWLSTFRQGRHPPQGSGVISVLHYWTDRPLRWYQSARRHRVGRAHALHVMMSTEPVRVPATEAVDERLVWIGEDDRGNELEIVALVLPDAVVVIHVMPTALRSEE